MTRYSALTETSSACGSQVHWPIIVNGNYLPNGSWFENLKMAVHWGVIRYIRHIYPHTLDKSWPRDNQIENMPSLMSW